MSRILIVDDDQDIARILRFRLQKKGFDCVLASNGLEALDKIDTHHPDLVLLDVMMPKMDGFTACREIRRRNAWSRIPVIMLTAKGDTTDKVSGISEGADDYVVKPFEFDELLARIQMILRRTSETMSANPLTGLPGNNIISKRIEVAIAAGQGFAACYVDLDYFKAYNDEYGFEAGDDIIKRTAEILVGVCQATSVVTTSCSWWTWSRTRPAAKRPFAASMARSSSSTRPSISRRASSKARTVRDSVSDSRS